MTIRWLANITSYQVVAELFGVWLSTIGEVVIEVCLARELELLRNIVKLGDVDKVPFILKFEE